MQERITFADDKLSPTALATRDLLLELSTSMPEVLPRSQVTELNATLKSAIQGWVSNGISQPIADVLNRIETGATAIGQPGQAIVGGVRWMRDDLRGIKPPRSAGGPPPSSEPGWPTPPATQKQPPYISARSVREGQLKLRRNMSDEELYSLAAQQRQRRQTAPPVKRRRLTPARLQGPPRTHVTYEEPGVEHGHLPSRRTGKLAATGRQRNYDLTS